MNVTCILSSFLPLSTWPSPFGSGTDRSRPRDASARRGKPSSSFSSSLPTDPGSSVPLFLTPTHRLSAFNFALSRRTPHSSISLAASMDPSGSAEAASASSPTARGLYDVLERAVGDDQAVPDSPLDADYSDPEARLAAELRRLASAQPRVRADPDTPAFGGASLPHQRFTSPAEVPRFLPPVAQALVATPQQLPCRFYRGTQRFSGLRKNSIPH